jgi:hypothetical protein
LRTSWKSGTLRCHTGDRIRVMKSTTQNNAGSPTYGVTERGGVSVPVQRVPLFSALSDGHAQRILCFRVPLREGNHACPGG